MWTQKPQPKFSKVILGVRVPDRLIVGCRWSLTGLLQKRDHTAVEIHHFKTLVAELLRCTSYLAVIHVNLLDLKDKRNADRSILLHLAKLRPESQFRILDPLNKWEEREGTPPNLRVWKCDESSDVKSLLLSEVEVWH